MLSLFPWSFPSPLTAFDPNSANLNTIPARLHARERRDIQGKTLMSASTPLHVPHPSDKLLFHRHQSLIGCYGKCGLPTCPLSKELKWYLTDFSMDYCWQTASQRCWYHLWHIPKRITLNIHCGPVLSDSDPITSWAWSLGHLLPGLRGANLPAAFFSWTVHIWWVHQHLPYAWTNSIYQGLLKSHSYNNWVIDRLMCWEGNLWCFSPCHSHYIYFMWSQRLFVRQENELGSRDSSQSL